MVDERLAFIEPLEERIGVPRGTLGPLLGEPNDWAFIVQLAVLLEAGLTEVLVRAIGKEQLRRHVSRLSQGGSNGRIQLALDIEVIDATSARRLKAVAGVRNSFAHRPSNLGGSLRDYVLGLDASQRQQLVLDLLGATKQKELPVYGEESLPADTVKYFLWLATSYVLTDLAMTDQKVEMRRQLDDLERWALDSYTRQPDGWTLSAMFETPDGRVRKPTTEGSHPMADTLADTKGRTSETPSQQGP